MMASELVEIFESISLLVASQLTAIFNGSTMSSVFMPQSIVNLNKSYHRFQVTNFNCRQVQ